MKMAEWGEEAWIQWLRKEGAPGRDFIGDDAALMSFLGTGDTQMVMSSDILIEETHFRVDWTAPEDLGWKALVVNVSDIFAMGGEPRYAQVSLGLPPTTDVAWLKALWKGLLAAATHFGVEITGGDTVRSTSLTLSVTILGEVKNSEVKMRSGAGVGHLIGVTGCLGDSAGGYRALERDLHHHDLLIQRHCHPSPNPKIARALAKEPGVSAMMDLSDGLLVDLGRLCEASQVGAQIEWDHLPISPALQTLCEEQGWVPEPLALSGGEDYQLLFTCEEATWMRMQTLPIFRIGMITSQTQGVTVGRGEEIIQKLPASFDHFVTNE